MEIYKIRINMFKKKNLYYIHIILKKILFYNIFKILKRYYFKYK